MAGLQSPLGHAQESLGAAAAYALQVKICVWIPKIVSTFFMGREGKRRAMVYINIAFHLYPNGSIQIFS
jgi:hypothetical protein